MCVLGPNGAGKTTLLKILSGFLAPDSGEVVIDGVDVACIEPSQRSRLVSVVMQNPPPALDFTVEEYLLTLAMPFVCPEREKVLRIHSALEKFELPRFASRSCLSLSGGELRRAVLAGAYAFHGRYILLDEPTAPLDPKHTLQAMRLFSELDDCGIFMITHSIELSVRFATKNLLLKDGAVSGERIDTASLEETFSCPFISCKVPGEGRAFYLPE